MSLRPGNPQGKGHIPLLAAHRQLQPYQPKPKDPEAMLEQLFSSMLVLNSHFSFRPVVGNAYYLYLKNHRWQLSLIEPETTNRLGEYFGECRLQPDMTWKITQSAMAIDSPTLQNGLLQFADGFQHWLSSDDCFQDKLPFFVERLPFYPRLAAAGLAKSVCLSTPTALLKQPAREWLENIENLTTLLAPTKTTQRP